MTYRIKKVAVWFQKILLILLCLSLSLFTGFSSFSQRAQKEIICFLLLYTSADIGLIPLPLMTSPIVMPPHRKCKCLQVLLNFHFEGLPAYGECFQQVCRILHERGAVVLQMSTQELEVVAVAAWVMFPDSLG